MENIIDKRRPDIKESERFIKIYFIGFDYDKIEEFYQKKKNQDIYYNSNKVIIDGREIKGIERFLMTLPDKNDPNSTRNAEVSEKDNYNIPITENNFIESTLIRLNYEYLVIKSRNLKRVTKTFIEYLENKKPETPDKKEPTFPTINKSIIDPEFVWDKYHNKVFECNRATFDSLLVNGIECGKTIKWTYSARQNKINIPQLKLFIEAITGDKENTGMSYIKKVFGLEVTVSDYKNKTTLSNHFKELKDKIMKNKMLKNK
ncbi:hypothetical protein TRIP_D170012 [uncultured Paludibacter sp.]|uniref:Uncharacterized protein n=1 Tax=uncultured Paludibacter sp. TaxID=497635 RepID=A0A653A649_9BACT|nr:hypothetical protein TRIP_D170012 [uncultured Paludibacter sp.]